MAIGGKVPLTLLSDPAAKCMDGTQAGYYYEPSKGGDWAQTGWVIHLQGGGECTDEASCTDQLGTARLEWQHHQAAKRDSPH